MNVSNYRPISVKPALSELMAKLFIPNFMILAKSVLEQPLLSIAGEILVSMEKAELCGAVFLELSKAFDTIDHAVMLKKLSAIGVSTDDLAWFASYLNCDPEQSKPLLCNFGVPQGSILAPLFFLICINSF